MKQRRKRPQVIATRMAGPDHAVDTVVGGNPHTYRRSPCQSCPWRVDMVGTFPAEAFQHAAGVACDMSTHTFACHESGQKAPATCAGFLLRNAYHNLSVRMKRMSGLIDYDQIRDGGHELFASYRDMAIANGVDPQDPALALCRANDE